MARYRMIQTNFWQDKFTLDLSFEEKYFYLYLLSNSKTKQCGIYEFSPYMASIELGLSEEKIKELINKLISYNKILFNEENEEIMLLNWHKYNVSTSRNTQVCINKELLDVKTKDFIRKFYELCKKRNYNLEVMFEGIEVTSADQSNLEVNNEGEKEVAEKPFKRVLEIFDNNIHIATFLELEELKSWCREIGEDLVILAIGEAVKNNVRTMKYINAILFNLKSQGIGSVSHAINYTEKRKFKNEKTYDFRPQNAAAYRIVSEEA